MEERMKLSLLSQIGWWIAFICLDRHLDKLLPELKGKDYWSLYILIVLFAIMSFLRGYNIKQLKQL